MEGKGDRRGACSMQQKKPACLQSGTGCRHRLAAASQLCALTHATVIPRPQPHVQQAVLHLTWCLRTWPSQHQAA